MATTSNHVLVCMADFGDEIEGDVVGEKRSLVDDHTSGGESDGNSGTWASAESDADVVPGKHRRRGAYHKSRPSRNNNPLALIQLSAALQSELKKLQQVAARGCGVSRAEWDKNVQGCKQSHIADATWQQDI